MKQVNIALLFTPEDFELLVFLAVKRGFVFEAAYERLPKSLEEVREAAVKDSINNLVRDYLDNKKGNR